MSFGKRGVAQPSHSDRPMSAGDGAPPRGPSPLVQAGIGVALGLAVAFAGYQGLRLIGHAAERSLAESFESQKPAVLAAPVPDSATTDGALENATRTACLAVASLSTQDRMMMAHRKE